MATNSYENDALLCRNSDNNQQNQTGELSPETQKFVAQKKKEYRERIKDDALSDVIKLRASNGGKSRKGDITKTGQKYKKAGYKYITSGVINYRLQLYNNNLLAGKGTSAVLQRYFESTVPEPTIVCTNYNNTNMEKGALSGLSSLSNVSSQLPDETKKNSMERQSAAEKKLMIKLKREQHWPPKSVSEYTIQEKKNI